MSLKIWQVDPANLTPYYNLAVCEALADAGQEVTYVTSEYLYDPHLPVSNKYTVEYAYFRGLNHQSLLHYSSLRKLLRGLSYPLDHRRVLVNIKRHHPDIIHIQWSRLPLFDRRFIEALRSLNIPIVHTVHNVRSSFASDRMVSQLGKIYALVDKLVLHTESNRRDFLTLYPHIPEAKTAIIPHINPPYPHQVGDVSPSELRKAFGFEENTFILLFFGGIRQYKGLTVLLDAFKEALQVNESVRLLIAGRAENTQDLEDVEQARSTRHVLVHEGFIPSKEMWKYFFVSDVAVLPYHYITQSGALIQAMNFGKPVIVTNVGGLPEVVDGNGWIVPKDNPHDLAEAILSAAQDRDDLLSKGKRSREIIEQHHSGKAIARQLIQVYRELL